MRKVLIVVLSLALSSTACSTAWVSTLDSILAAAAPALINILQIVSVANSEPMNSTLAAKIDDDAVAIKTLAADFAKDGGSNACTILQNAVATYQVDQALVLQLAQVKDSNTQTKIALLADLVSGTIGAITAVIPACQPSTASPKSADVERLLKLGTLRGELQRHSYGQDRERSRGRRYSEVSHSPALESGSICLVRRPEINGQLTYSDRLCTNRGRLRRFESKG